MLMRFHWGLGVGHVYTHRQPCTAAAVVWGSSESESFQSGNVPQSPEPLDQTRMEGDISSGPGTDGSGSDSDDRDYELSEEDGDDKSDDDDDDSEEEVRLLDMDEMYGSIYSDEDD
jgi:hypothetical protein